MPTLSDANPGGDVAVTVLAMTAAVTAMTTKDSWHAHGVTELPAGS